MMIDPLRRGLVAAVAAVWVAAGPFAHPPCVMAANPEVLVDPSKIAHPRFEGIGTNVSSNTVQFDWPAPALDLVRGRLDAMRLPRVRLWCQLNAHKTVPLDLDSADRWDTPPWERIVAWARLLRQTGGGHTRLEYCPLGSGEPYAVPSARPVYGTPEWSREIAKQVGQLTATAGCAPVVGVEVNNEPSDVEAWQRGVVHLDGEMRRHGLHPSVRVSGPGFFRNAALKSDAWWSARTADWSHHLYFGLNELGFESGGLVAPLKEVRAWLVAKNPPQPLVFGEYGDGRFKGALPGETDSHPDSQQNIRTHRYGLEVADLSIQAMNAGVQRMHTWMLDETGRLTPGKAASVKNWGLWEPYELDPRMTLRPWFYAHCLLSRFAWADATVCEVETGDPHLRVTALRRNGSDEWTVLALNRGDSASPVRLRKSDGGGRGTLTHYRYANDAPEPLHNRDYARYTQDANGFPVPAGTLADVNLADGLDVTLPAFSFQVFTGTLR